MPIQKLPGTAIEPASIPSTAIASNVVFFPKISNVQVTDSGYTVLDDTAVSVSGGYIKITGTDFASGCSVIIGTTAAASVSFVSATEVRAQVPALVAGTYIVYVVNPDGSVAIRVNGLNVSAMPAWSTTSPLASGVVDAAISIQLAATSNSSVTYALQAGSTLPAGLSLTSAGLLSGTVTGLSVETVYNFTVVATDAELQDTPRAFSITISVADPNFRNVVTLLSASNPTSTFVTDASANAFAVTVNGDTRPSNFGPYTPGYYSNYFDGTGDSLAISSSAVIPNTQSTFTIEGWLYMTANPVASGGGNIVPGMFGDMQPSGVTNYLSMGPVGSAGTYYFGFYWYDSTSRSVRGDTVLALNTWYHLAVSVSGNVIKLFVNGVEQTLTGTTTLTNRGGNSGTFAVGNYNTNTSSITGYISNLRVVNGTAVYTSNFTPSTTPLTAIANTSLLTCSSNRFIDTSTNNFTITRNGDVRVDSFDPFVPVASTTGSVYLDGNSDYLGRAYSADFNLGSTYTIEMWAYSTTASGWKSLYAMDFALTDFFGGMNIGLSGATGKLYFSMQINTGSGFQSSAVTIPAINNYVNGQWYHVAISVNAGTGTFYVNGQAQGSATVSEFTGTPVGFGIGAHYNGYNVSSEAWPGYIADFRIVKGTAVYTANFTPATSSLTAINNTLLLTAQTNQPANNNVFLDSSTNNFNITRNGNTTQGSFSPYGGGWSNYMGGDGNYLSAPYNTSFDFGTGDFSVECFAYVIDAGRGQDANKYGTLVSGGLAATTTNFWNFTHLISGGVISFLSIGVGAADVLTVSGLSISLNAWHHFVACRTGTTLSIFVDGARVATTAYSSAINTNSSGYVVIGRSVYGSPYQNWTQGYFSNVRIIKGTQPYNAGSTTITVPTSPLTPIANTSLLTCADNRFIDDSTNNLTVTANGTPSVQRFNPFNPVLTTPTSYSAYFDGTGDGLTITATGVGPVGTQDYTVEFWMYASSLGGNAPRLFEGQGDVGQFQVYLSNGTLYLANSGFTNWLSYNITSLTNQWLHICLTRSGSALRLFVNGVLRSYNTSNVSFSDAGSWIVLNSGGGIIGYQSNLRIVKGSVIPTYDTAVTTTGTTVFTPPTTPLTAVSGTSLLTLQSSTLIDNSTNNYTITGSGNISPRQFNPFGWTTTTGAAYTPALYGGSAYFDGTGDWLSLPSNSAFNQNSVFTLECWVGFGSGFFYAQLLNGFLCLALNSDGSVIVDKSYVGTTITTAAGVANINAWNHIALVFNGTNHRLFVNGILRGTASGGGAASGATQTIGRYDSGPNYFTGYMSDLRIIQGSTLYTSNFVPPVTPLTAIPNTVFMLSMTGAGIYDSAAIANYETAGNAGINTAFKKYGNTSMSFDGTGDKLFAPSSVNFQFGTSDFTIEFWVYLNTVAGNQVLYDQRPSEGAYPTIYMSGSNIRYYQGSADRITGATLSTGQWYHVALSRSATSTRLFVNGTQSGSTYTDSTNYLVSPLRIGCDFNNTSYLNGYIDDLRITRGVARYTTTFTPTGSPFIRR